MGGLDAGALAYYADGARYDAEYVHVRYDVPYYASIAAESAADSSGRVLELACGTGRLTIPMAEAGARVLGIDVVPAMIAEARRKRARLPAGDQGRLEFAVGDMRTLSLKERFPTVILGFNTLMHMVEDEDLEALLGTVHTHLEDGGMFHFDLHTPFPPSPGEPEGAATRSEPIEVIDPGTRSRYLVSDSNTYDARTQINTMSFHYQRVDALGQPLGPETVHDLRLRVFFPRELDRWLHLAGFTVVGDWDDFEHNRPFTGNGGRRLVSARKR